MLNKKIAQFEYNAEFSIENNVLKGKKVVYDEEYTSLGKLILDNIEKDLDFVGLIDSITGREYTYEKMRDRSVRCALWMKSQGVLPGDVVALCSEDRLDFALPCFAALYIGAVFTPWDVTTIGADFTNFANTAKPKMVFACDSSARVIAKAAKQAKLDLKIVVFGHVSGLFQFESIIAEPGIDEVENFVCTPLDSSAELAFIMFSSGTTGRPKGVAISHGAMIAQMKQSAKLVDAYANMCLSFTSTSWISFVRYMIRNVYLKTPGVILPPFDVESTCAIIEKYKVEQVIVNALLINLLVKSDALTKYDLSSLVRVLHGGTTLALASYEALVTQLPNVKVFEAYGLTETGGVLTLQSTKSPFGSCGTVFENVQLKIVDPSTGRILGPNENGELMVKSVSMMSYYYNDPKTTAQAFDEEGWLHTGDFGYFDENGEIFVVARMKDLLKCEDGYVFPNEIENVILSHPGVEQVAVLGQPRDQASDRLIAFVVKMENTSDSKIQVTEAEIVSLVADKLPASRRLNGGVKFIDFMPKTGTNKVRRTALRELAESAMLEI